MNRACRECGKEFKRRTYNAAFCGGICRKVWGNRRARRGAHAYDLMMLRKFEPDKLIASGAHSHALELATTAWHADDVKHSRKRSWLAANEVARTPLPI